MTIFEMKQKLRELYGRRWQERVDKMSDAQVIAIFKKFVANGKIKN